MGWVIEYLQKMELRYWWKNMNKLVERKACVDNVWIKSANYTKVQVIQSVALAEVHMK